MEWSENSVGCLPGIGPKRVALYEKLGVRTVEDLLSFYPRGYEDWSATVTLQEAVLRGEACCVRAYVTTAPEKHLIRRGMTLYKFRVRDESHSCTVTLFNNPYAAAKIYPGETLLLFGTVNYDGRFCQMSAPRIEKAEGGDRIRPIYRQTEGLTSRMIEANVAAALERCGDIADPLPEELRRSAGLCDRQTALHQVHFPDSHDALEAARRRLVYEELFFLQLGMLRIKGRNRARTGAVFTVDHSGEFLAKLPFTPTGAQMRAVADCVRDCASGYPMNRLVQGDVGSGKTAVAAAVGYHVIRNGYQVALMAPTEILAEQHFRTLSGFFAGTGMRVALLTGATKAAERRALCADLARGAVDFVVGTHALLTEGVDFAALGLVITDEQHRFGVEQRAKLTAKGENPHLLVMSATPIPRTLALIVYGDLDVSVLDELPPGRTPIATYAVGTDKRERAYGYVRKHLDEGRQAYVVCPLVEESEVAADDLVPATEYIEALRNGPLRGYSLGLLHGRMKPAEKDAVMGAFSRGEIQVLVSTTVIEVGVDVPNAVIMVIENADRFGLAQLHQLRGRVGRGQYASTCILITDAQNEEAVRRLKVMCRTSDGFVIAEEDLRLRGPGDFFGNRQHGLPSLKIADLQGGDMALFGAARDAASALIAADPELKSHPLLDAQVTRLYARDDGGNSMN